jgi:hypothetical protein
MHKYEKKVTKCLVNSKKNSNFAVRNVACGAKPASCGPLERTFTGARTRIQH